MPDNCDYNNINELVLTTNPQAGEYIIQLYGNTYIHQKPSTTTDNFITSLATITAYQSDNAGRLFIISEICQAPYIGQLSVSADGRFFGFITVDGDITTAYVYFLDTLDQTLGVAYSWAYKFCINPCLFFSINGQFAIFCPSINKMCIQPLYTDDPEMVVDSDIINNNKPTNMVLNNLVINQGLDYLVWIQPSCRIIVIDLVSGQAPKLWDTEGMYLNMNYSSCMIYNDFIIHFHQPNTNIPATITILALNTITRTIVIGDVFKFPEKGPVSYYITPDGKSINIHNYNKNRETRMTVALPAITACFSDVDNIADNSILAM